MRIKFDLPEGVKLEIPSKRQIEQERACNRM
jgi:hypothetical protein